MAGKKNEIMKFTGKWMGTRKHCTEVTWAQKDKQIMLCLTL